MKPSEVWREIEPSELAQHAVFGYNGHHAYAVEYEGVAWGITLMWADETHWIWTVSRDDFRHSHVQTPTGVSREAAMKVLETAIEGYNETE